MKQTKNLIIIWLFGKFLFGYLVSIHLVFCGILLLLFVVIHFGFLRYAHHFGAVPFGSLAQFRSGVWLQN